MRLEKVYARAGGRRTPWTCILAPDGRVPAQGPWACVYIACDHEPDLAALSTLPGIFQRIDDRDPPKNLAFLFFEQGTSSAQVEERLGPALDAMKWGIAAAERGGALAWFDDPAAVSKTAFDAAPKLKLKTVNPRRPRKVYGAVLAYPEREPLLALEPGNEKGERLFVHSSDESVNRVKLGSNAAGDALTLTSDLALSVTLGTKRAEKKRKIADVSGGFEIPLTGPRPGGLAFEGRFEALISRLGIGFQYALRSEAGESGILYYPLLDAPDGFDGRQFTASLHPTAPLDPLRTFWSPAPDKGPVRSAFRTLLDRAVLLRPQAGGASRLVFNGTFGGVRYLTPDGPYGLDIEGDGKRRGGTLQSQLRCGLSGVEYVHFTPGHRLHFHSGQPAAVAVVGAGENATFRLDTEDLVKTTAWLMVLPAEGAAPSGRQYYSQPDQAPFFAKPGQGDGSHQLGYFPVTRAALPDEAGAADDPYRFPLVPYAAVPELETGFGADPALVEAFERRFLNPLRKRRIADMAKAEAGLLSHSDGAGGPVTAVTPQGYAATFDGGTWRRLQVAEARSNRSRVEVSFGAADGGPLPDALQDAFLTNQQFLVITAAENLGDFAPTIEMDGWPFDLDPSRNTTVGDYRNVILFKNARGTVSQLARQPELWTRPRDFNRSDGDPEGRFLSNWLVDYLEQAKELHDGGVESLGPFCDLVDDPEWNGFLALKVDVKADELPPEIAALLAGIDEELFFAHHLGSGVNHVTPGDKPGRPYDLNSPVFALIFYADPELGARAEDIPPYMAGPRDFDFRVLTLEAVFRNAELVHFSNKSLLLANRLFGERVAEQGRTDGEAGHNNLTLIGTYQDKQGEPSYTFATGQGVTTDFYLGGTALDRVRVSRADMTVTGDKDRGYRARFGFWGNLRFLDDPVFDLLSYAQLGFQNLALDMNLPPGAGERSFAFDPSGMALALSRNQLAAAAGGDAAGGFNLVRAGSLLAQFPLKLAGFVTGRAGGNPVALGFRPLATLEPKGITPPDLAGGEWYGLAFDMNLGGQGALAADAGLSAQLLLAWSPGGAGAAARCLPALKISGPGGASLGFDIQGVIKFGAADVVLNKIKTSKEVETPDQFLLVFESIALSLLGLSFPPKGTTNVFLFGDLSQAGEGAVVDPTLGWFGGYVRKKAGGTG